MKSGYFVGVNAMDLASAWKKSKKLGEPKKAAILLKNVAMLVLIQLIVFVVPAQGSVTPWYPYLLPIHAPTYHHRHTTHIVPQPIVHTRVVVLDDGLSQQQPRIRGNNLLLRNSILQHQHVNQYLHQYGNLRPNIKALLSQRVKSATQGRSNAVIFPKSTSGKSESSHLYPEDYRQFKYGHRSKYYHSKPHTKYSVPASESPWKPLMHVPNYVSKGYVPLKYLGVYEDSMSKATKDSMNEIDVEHPSQLRFPSGILSMIEPQMKPLPAMYRGAVFYDEDHRPKNRQARGSGYVTNKHFQKDAAKKSSFNLNMECQCQGPFSNKDFS